MPERTFSAPYDSTTKLLSAVVCLILVVVAFLVHIIFVALLMPLLILLAYAYSTRGYAIAGDAVVVKRLIGDVRVPRAGIREIRPGTQDDFTGCIRLWGSGGLFGYYGLFRTSRLGKCSWYVTNRSNTVIVTTQTKTLVLSPGGVQEFIAAAGVLATGAPPQFSSGGNSVGMMVGLGIAMSALALVALTFVYAPGPAGYTLTADRLTIHDMFYGVTLRADAVDLAHVRVIDLAQDPEWRPTLRTNGFANRNYQSGWFRVAGGRTVRLYRAGSNRLVLIPPKGDGAFVLYQAKDPEAFVQKLHQQWAR